MSLLPRTTLHSDSEHVKPLVFWTGVILASRKKFCAWYPPRKFTSCEISNQTTYISKLCFFIFKVLKHITPKSFDSIAKAFNIVNALEFLYGHVCKNNSRRLLLNVCRTRGKKTSIFRFRLQQTNEGLPFLFFLCSKQTEVLVFC